MQSLNQTDQIYLDHSRV